MSVFSTITIIIFILYLIGLLIILKKNKESLKFIFFQAVVAWFIMTIINLTGFATNLHIPINENTVLGVGFGGVPFMIGFLILRTIFVL